MTISTEWDSLHIIGLTKTKGVYKILTLPVKGGGHWGWRVKHRNVYWLISLNEQQTLSFCLEQEVIKFSKRTKSKQTKLPQQNITK